MNDANVDFSRVDALTQSANLYKLWHVEIFGPYLMGESTSKGWRLRDVRANSDHIVGKGVDGRADARDPARCLVSAIPEQERARLTDAARARIGFDNTSD